jgi:hypothetical protein
MARGGSRAAEPGKATEEAPEIAEEDRHMEEQTG